MKKHWKALSNWRLESIQMHQWAHEQAASWTFLMMVWKIHGTRNISYVYVINIAVDPWRGKLVWIMASCKTAHPLLTVIKKSFLIFFKHKKSLWLLSTYYSMPSILSTFHISSEIFISLICFLSAIIIYSIKTHFCILYIF